MNIFSIFTLIICRPFGYVLGLCYTVGRDYGVALILFTLITRILLFPLAVKQQKSTSEMVRMRPKLEQLQKKFAKDKQKLNDETMKLYQEEGYSPLAGCLPMLIQLPIIWGLFTIIYQPLTYIIGLSAQNIEKIVALAKLTPAENSRREIYAAQYMSQHMDKLTFLPQNTHPINFYFLNIDLSQTPAFKFEILILIPILCYITSFVSSWFSMKMNAAASPQQTAGMNRMMIVLMPLMSTWFSFQVPAGVGFYWIVTNLFMILQVLILNKFYNPVKLAALAEEKRSSKKTQSISNDVEIKEVNNDNNEISGDAEDNKSENKIEAKQNYKNVSQEKMSKKEIKQENRKKLAQARAAELKRKNSQG